MSTRLVSLVLAVGACGPMNRNAANANHDGSDSTTQAEMVCHDEKDTGSMMNHRVCQPRNHTTSDDDRHDTEQLLGKPKNQPTSHH
jgi:hypothetical protein